MRLGVRQLRGQHHRDTTQFFDGIMPMIGIRRNQRPHGRGIGTAALCHCYRIDCCIARPSRVERHVCDRIGRECDIAGRDGGFYSITLIQDGTGSRTASWNSVFHFAGGSAPTLTTTASAVDIMVFRSNGTNMLEVGRQLDLKTSA